MGRKFRNFFVGLLVTAMVCTGNTVVTFAQVASQNTKDISVITEDIKDYQKENPDQDSELVNDEEVDFETEISESDDVSGNENSDLETIEECQEKNQKIGDFISEFSEESDSTFSDTGEKQENSSVKVYFSVSDDADFDIQKGTQVPVALRKLTVPYFDLSLYGLEKFYLSSGHNENGVLIPGTAETAKNEVTMLHLFIYATEVLYFGVNENEAGKGYLKEQNILGTDALKITGTADSLYITGFWGMDQNFNYYLNYEYPMARPGWGATADQIVLMDDDVVTMGHFADWSFFSDPTAGFNYLKVNGNMTQTEVNKSEADSILLEVYRTKSNDEYGTEQIKLTGKHKLYYMPVLEIQGGKVTDWKYLGETEEDGNLKVNLMEIPEGDYLIAVAGMPGNSTQSICSTPGGIHLSVVDKRTSHECQWDSGVVIRVASCVAEGEIKYKCIICGAEKTEKISKTQHSYKWKKISSATVFLPEKQKGVCKVCGKTTTRENGKKLKATIKLNAKNITLQKKQVFKKIKVIMSEGDYVKSWHSSNNKIVTVSKSGVIRAGNKTGTAKITVTLKSGKKSTLEVKVQISRVKTKRISGIKKSMVLKNSQKMIIKPIISPLTSQEKITYTSFDKKIATVSKNGVITAKKKGNTKIKIKSGSKTCIITVKVK